MIRVSLAPNGSQGGNGLLHLIHIASRELEHRGDRSLLGELQFLQGLVSGLHLSHNRNQKMKGTESQPHHLTKTDRSHTYHLVGAGNLKGSSLGEESLGEGVKFPELDCGRLDYIFLLDGGLPQLVSFGLHL